MEILTEKVKTILNGSPTRTMPLSQVLRSLSASGICMEGRAGWLIQRLTEDSDHFRVLPDRLGPWIQWPERHGITNPSQDFPGDPWVMAGPHSPDGSRAPSGVIARLQETLSAWGWKVDDGSQVGVARWLQANREAEHALERLLSPSGDPARIHPSTTPPPGPPPPKRIPGEQPLARSQAAGHPKRH